MLGTLTWFLKIFLVAQLSLHATSTTRSWWLQNENLANSPDNSWIGQLSDSNSSSNTTAPFFKDRVKAFTEEMAFSGEWLAESAPQSSLFNSFASQSGPCTMLYMVSPTSN